jgi:dTDP-4-amino-4,6-dideoxygalactose transaminase
VQKRLTDAGVGTGIHYPIPLHLTKAYESFGFRRGDFPVSERIAAHGLSLPMFPTLSGDQQRRVVAEVMRATSAK